MSFKKLLSSGRGCLLGGLLGVTLGALLMLDVGAVLRLEKLGKIWGHIGTLGDKVGQRMQNLSYDLLFLFRKYRVPQEVVIVLMDDISHERLNQPYNAPWDRTLHARMLDRLRAEGAKLATFDIVFTGRTEEKADQEFARAIKEFGKVVLAADWVAFEGGTGGGEKAAGSKTVLPDDLFLENVAGVGTAETKPDPDFCIRKHFPGSPGELVSSLSWTAAEVAGAEITKHEDQKFKTRWVKYYAPPRRLPIVSFYQVVSTNADERLPAGFFKDKYVFVGAGTITKFSGERKDEYKNPYAAWTIGSETQQVFMPGVEVQATVFLNLLRADWLRRVPFLTDLWLVLLAGLVFGVGLALLKPFHAATTAIVSSVAIGGIAYYFFAVERLWFSWFIISGIQISLTALCSVIYNSISLYVQKKLVEQSLSMYVSPSRVKQILKNPAILKPGAEKHELSVLFSDIAGFTTISEGMDSDELAHLMNRYFETTVGSCIDPAAGTVVKFIGDAIFAIWNAPELQQNHQELACKGALLLRDHSAKFAFKPGVEIRTRVGLHCGVANVGNFGSSRRIDYTALGENINLASRMEGLNKYLGTDVLITGDIHASVKEKFTTRFCGRFQLKGFEKAVSVHELVGGPEAAGPTRPWREAYDQALKHFEKGDLDAAEAAFRCTLEIRPKDGPSEFFLKTIPELRQHPAEGEWTDVVELKEK